MSSTDSSNVGDGVGIEVDIGFCSGSGVDSFGSGVEVVRTGVSVHRSAPWGARKNGSEAPNEGNEHDKLTTPMKSKIQMKYFGVMRSILTLDRIFISLTFPSFDINTIAVQIPIINTAQAF